MIAMLQSVFVKQSSGKYTGQLLKRHDSLAQKLAQFFSAVTVDIFPVCLEHGLEIQRTNEKFYTPALRAVGQVDAWFPPEKEPSGG